MRILVKENQKSRVNLKLPTGLLCNRIVAMFVPGALKKHGIRVTAKQACAFVKALNNYRRSHKEWVLAEVDSTDGTHIFVKL